MSTQDTPAPALAADADDGLNAEIAKALGWRTVPRGNGYLLVDPANNERWDGASHIAAECWRVVPEYDSDPAAALRLLADVLSLCDHNGYPRFEAVVERTAMNGLWSVKLHGWADEARENPGAFADTLERAIALTCRDALSAIAGEQSRGSE